MAIYIHCPHCHERLEVVGQHCTHCGLTLPPGVAYVLSSALGNTPMPSSNLSTGLPPTYLSSANALTTLYPAEERHTPTGHHSALRPWLAATLSLICGLGQLYNGQIIKGVALLIGGILAVATWPFLLGKVAALILWGYALSDAYLVARHA